jgi:hypothetical protein
MTDLKINRITDDIELTEAIDFETIDEADEVAQQLYVMFRMQEGEWFLNLGTGIDYLGEILKRNPNLAIIKAQVRTKIIETDNVNAILEIDMDLDLKTRTLDIGFKVDTAFGPIQN